MFDRISFSAIVENLHDGLYFVDRDRIIRYWNKAAERISGFTADEVVGRSCADSILTHVDDCGNLLCHGRCPLASSIASGITCETEAFMHHKAGHRIPVSIRANPLRDKEGRIIGGVELFTEISNYKAVEARVKELEELAFLDNLTRVANRHYIERELTARFEERRRYGVPFGILFIDIDRFKKFNDSYGHDIGDLVLKFVAETMVKNLRPFDLLGRWGGEEFIAILRNIMQRDLEELGNRLRKLVETSYILVGDERLQVTISAGATIASDGDEIETLVKRADTLLYESKEAGRNRLTYG